jgi:TPR repeat protein
MGAFVDGTYEEKFERFRRSAAKGHEESIWILSVVRDAEMEWEPLVQTFAKTEQPLGWYFAGALTGGEKRFDFFQKSAEGGCSWAQWRYGSYFRSGKVLVEKDEKVYLEWLEKAVNQNNPEAMHDLGGFFWQQLNPGKAVPLYQAATELGWKASMNFLSRKWKSNGNLRESARWAAKSQARSPEFWIAVINTEKQSEEARSSDLYYILGWGLYWYTYDEENFYYKEHKEFCIRCLEYYCSSVELQQESIFTFLMFWNRTAGGVKGPGQMIGKMVWEGREENLVKSFEKF